MYYIDYVFVRDKRLLFIRLMNLFCRHIIRFIAAMFHVKHAFLFCALPFYVKLSVGVLFAILYI